MSINTLAFALLMGWTALFTTGLIVSDLFYARPRGFPRWKNLLAPDLLVSLACIALLVYPFTKLPHVWSVKFKSTVDEEFIVLMLLFVGWFVASLSVSILKSIVKGGVPRSFIATLVRRLFRKGSEAEAHEKIRAIQYAVMGTFGTTYCSPWIDSLLGIGFESGGALIVGSGLMCCLLLWIVRRAFNAIEL